ncbi:uncharacterized protein [Miscanthus floridulus]|uniref:uncharacterized protein n=1 Tax=Miscanthus floridulus TaxID=154761 RepID=UPI0034595303
MPEAKYSCSVPCRRRRLARTTAASTPAPPRPPPRPRPRHCSAPHRVAAARLASADRALPPRASPLSRRCRGFFRARSRAPHRFDPALRPAPRRGRPRPVPRPSPLRGRACSRTRGRACAPPCRAEVTPPPRAVPLAVLSPVVGRHAAPCPPPSTLGRARRAGLVARSPGHPALAARAVVCRATTVVYLQPNPRPSFVAPGG